MPPLLVCYCTEQYSDLLEDYSLGIGESCTAPNATQQASLAVVNANFATLPPNSTEVIILCTDCLLSYSYFLVAVGEGALCYFGNSTEICAECSFYNTNATNQLALTEAACSAVTPGSYGYDVVGPPSLESNFTILSGTAAFFCGNLTCGASVLNPLVVEADAFGTCTGYNGTLSAAVLNICSPKCNYPLLYQALLSVNATCSTSTNYIVQEYWSGFSEIFTELNPIYDIICTTSCGQALQLAAGYGFNLTNCINANPTTQCPSCYSIYSNMVVAISDVSTQCESEKNNPTYKSLEQLASPLIDLVGTYTAACPSATVSTVSTTTSSSTGTHASGSSTTGSAAKSSVSIFVMLAVLAVFLVV
jgi:hypothetical protein